VGGGVLDVGVDVVGPHVGPPAAVLVGEQLGAAAPAALERRHDLAHVLVRDGLDAPLARLGGVVEHDLVVLDGDVASQHRGQAVALVGDGVVLGADAEEPEVEQAGRACEDTGAVERVAAQVAAHAAAQLGQGLPELDHRAELLLVAAGAPLVVVAVLLAAGVVDPRRLEVAVRVEADPHVPPCGRDRQVGDALERLRIVDSLPVRIEVLEAAAPAAPRDAGRRAVGSSQPRHALDLPAMGAF
jgi:hypothetical protein